MTEGDVPEGKIYELTRYPGQLYRKISSTTTMALNADGTDRRAEIVNPFSEVCLADPILCQISNKDSSFEQRVYDNDTQKHSEKVQIVIYPRYDKQIRIRLNSPGLSFSLSLDRAKVLNRMLTHMLSAFEE